MGFIIKFIKLNSPAEENPAGVVCPGNDSRGIVGRICRPLSLYLAVFFLRIISFRLCRNAACRSFWQERFYQFGFFHAGHLPDRSVLADDSSDACRKCRWPAAHNPLETDHIPLQAK